MKKIFALIAIVMMATIVNSCSSLSKVPQSSNKLSSPFPTVKTTELTFVENYVTYTLGAPYAERVGKQSELKNDLRGELALAIYSEVKTYNESRTVRNAGDEEYSKDFLAWTLTTANMKLPGDVVYTTEEEVKKGNTVYYWVRISTDKKKLSNFYEKSVKADKKNATTEAQAERRHEENMAKINANI